MGRKYLKFSSLLYLIIIILLCIIVLLLNDRCVTVNESRRGPGAKSAYAAYPQPVVVSERKAAGSGRRLRNQDGGDKQTDEDDTRTGKEDGSSKTENQDEDDKKYRRKVVVTYDKKDNEYEYGPDAPFIFIGGVPRSGTTLMRAMLDAHPDVRCGEETRVIPRILGMRANWRKNQKEKKRLDEAGINDFVIDSAITAFMLEVIAKHGAPANRLCNKDPFTLKSGEYLLKLFPNAKFLMMIRDGRATVHSIITRKVTITGFDLGNYRQCMEKWNQAIQAMYQQCYNLGDQRCKPVYYEQLVLHPEKSMRDILEFLNLPWNNSVLSHEMFIGKKISLSNVERSSSQIIRPVNTDALTKWVGNLPEEVVQDMPKIAPMLQQLGYDPYANPPNYGQADAAVVKKTDDMHKNAHVWKQKISEVLKGAPNLPPEVKNP